jgi:hypothetical protein
MSEIAAIAQGLSASAANTRSLLAIKLQHQQEQAVVDLLEKVLQSTPSSDGAAPAGNRLVDVVV